MARKRLSEASDDLLDRFRLNAEFHESHTLQQIEDRTGSDCSLDKAAQTWQRGRALGEGAFAQVYQENFENHRGEWQYRAVKVCKKARMTRAGVDYRRELSALAILSSSKFSGLFLRLNGWWMDEANLYIALEYLRKGDLSSYIEHGLSEQDILEITEDVLNGLHILHENGFSHRDIKPQNILVKQKPPESQKWWVKIADFGISKRILEDSNTYLHTFIGTRPYCAPEILGYLPAQHQSSHYTNKVDMWSLGCVLFNMGTRGQMPFSDPELVKYCNGISQFSPIEKLSSLGSKGVSLTLNLLQWNPDLRPTAAEALNFSWFFSSVNPSQGVCSQAQVPALQANTQKDYNASMQSSPSETTGDTGTGSSLSFSAFQVVDIVDVKPKLPYERIVHAKNAEGLPTTICGQQGVGSVKALAFAVGNCGESFAIGCTLGYIDIWSASKSCFEKRRTIRPHQRDISSLVLSPTTRIGASSEISPVDGTRSFKVWDAETDRILHDLAFGELSPAGPILEFSYSGDYIFAGYHQSTIVRWCIETGEIKEIFKNSGPPVIGIKLSPYVSYVMASIQFGGHIKLWRATTNFRYSTITTDSDQGGGSVQFGATGLLWFHAAMSPGEVAEYSLVELAKVWQAEPTKHLANRKLFPRRRVEAFPELEAARSSRTVISPELYAAEVVHDAACILVWDVKTCTPMGKLQGTSNSKIVCHTFWSDSSYLAVVHEDGTVEIWSWPFASEDLLCF